MCFNISNKHNDYKGHGKGTTQDYRIMKLGKKNSRRSRSVTVRGEDIACKCMGKRQRLLDNNTSGELKIREAQRKNLHYNQED